jgi:hypothetical protein
VLVDMASFVAAVSFAVAALAVAVSFAVAAWIIVVVSGDVADLHWSTGKIIYTTNNKLCNSESYWNIDNNISNDLPGPTLYCVEIEVSLYL